MNSSPRSLRAPGIVVSMLLCGSAASHHGFYGQFALEERIDLAGEVVAVEWQNPHAFVVVRVPVDDSEAIVRIELRSVTQLADMGWNGDELAVGESVSVIGAAPDLTDGSTLVCCARIYNLDGKEYFTGPRWMPDRPD